MLEWCIELIYPIRKGLRLRVTDSICGVFQGSGVLRLMRSFGVISAVALALVVGGAVSSVSPASAETLREAMISAYRRNPTLQAERARQRVTDELVSQAKSGWRPTINGQEIVSQTWSDTTPGAPTHPTSLNMNIQLSQPIFRGYRTVEGIKQAEARVKAGRENLLAVEQDVLLRAVTAYADVLRDRKILDIRRKNLVNLQKEAKAAQARFSAGELTRTDVAQARAQVSAAQGAVATATANLGISSAAYLAVIGHEPGKLAAATRGPVPKNLSNALNVASETNPSVLAAAYVHDASLHDVNVAKGALLPTLSLQASASATRNFSIPLKRSESATIQGVLNVPIYQAGNEYSAIRQAKQQASQTGIQIISATRAVRQQVAVAWATYTASGQAITSAKAQVASAALALDGVQQEYQVGSRTTVDVLNAELTLLAARITLAVAEHDQLVASYQLVSSIGRLTARRLSLGGPYYDPVQNYNNVKNKWIGTDADTLQ
jgi:outer membrane protein